MANPNSPFGFRPIIRAGGSPFSVTEYGKAAADTHAIYMFDLVGHLTGGTSWPVPENATYNLPRIQSGSQITPGTGLWLGATLAYGKASTGSVHPVADQIDCIFLAQAGNGATAVTNDAHVGLNANVYQGAAGSDLTRQSAMCVDVTTILGTNSLDLRIRSIAMISPNVEGAYSILEVQIQKHAYGQTTTAV